jgi:hypothetical protein
MFDREFVFPKRKALVIVVAFLLMLGFFVVVARGDALDYDLVEGRYYHVDAEDNQDGWFSYRKVDSQFTLIYQYDSREAITLNHTSPFYLEYGFATATKFGWALTWKGNVTAERYTFELSNIFGDVVIDESFSEADKVSAHFQMKLNSPSYRRFIEDDDSRVVVELLDVVVNGSEFQVYDRFGNKTQWENREEFNLTDSMIFKVNKTNVGEEYVNCTVTSSTDNLNVTVWSEWDAYVPEVDSPIEGDQPDTPKFNVSYVPETPTTYQWVNITLDADMGFTEFYVYAVTGEGGYRYGDNSALSTAIMFYAEGQKVFILAGAYENGTIVLSEGHTIMVSGEGTPSGTGDTPPDGSGQNYDQNIPFYILIAGGIIAYGVNAAANRWRPKKDRRKVVTSGSALWGLGLDDDYAPEPLKKEYELLTSKMDEE